MGRPLRNAWISAVDPDDYEKHMAAIGQAKANAEHVEEFVLSCITPAVRILVAGAGTGQMFDFISPSVFRGVHAVFSDINQRFLVRLRRRFPGAECVADDMEQSSLRGPFDAACAVLVLEHIDWRKGLNTLTALSPRHLFLVVQRNPAGLDAAVTASRVLPETMRAVAESHPVMLDPKAITAQLSKANYSLLREVGKPVDDGKTMLGLLFGLP